MFSFQILKHVLRCHVLSGLCLFRLIYYLQFFKKYDAYLTWRRDVEWFAGKILYFFFQLIHFLCEFLRCLLQRLGVDHDPVSLHQCQNGHERHFYFLKQLCQSCLFQFFLQTCFQLKRDVCILCCIFVHRFRFEVAHVLLVLAPLPYQLVNMDGFIFQIYFCHVVHSMT